jgi:hypothetical protein
MGGIFKRQELDLSFLNGGIVSNIALVDLNSDARLDVFISTIMQGTHVLWNQGGNFTADARTELPNSDAYITTASGFADFDGDGNLDIVLGNGIVSLGKNATVQYGPKATNRVLWNEGDGTFTPKDFELGGARTLTILITDINEDDEPDILIGDDNGWTDTVYTYAGNREFRFVTRSDGLIPETGKTTMSFDAADWQRNGRQAIYLGQALAENDLHPSEFLKQTKLFCQSEMQDPNTQYSSAENCFNLAQSMDKASQISRRNRADCNQLSSQSAKALCATRNIITRALKESRPEMCDPIR